MKSVIRFPLESLLCVLLFLTCVASVLAWNQVVKNWNPAPTTNHLSSSTTARNEAEVADSKAKFTGAFGKLPISFEVNEGQADASVKYLARGKGFQLLLSANQSSLTLQAPDSSTETIEMRLVGGKADPSMFGEDRLPGIVNYLLGSDPQAWKTNISTFAKVRYKSIYEGIDLVYYGNQNRLEYDFIVAPNANPTQIAIDFGETNKLKINRSGELVIQAKAGELRQLKPMIYQLINGERHEISSQYYLSGKHQVRFRIGKYDRSRALVIDPVLVYSTFLGGSSTDQGLAIAVDTNGNAYITGDTISTNFTLEAPFQAAIGGTTDAFVVKLNATGTAMLYATYLGGPGGDSGKAIAVYQGGIVHVAGQMGGGNFPGRTTGRFFGQSGGLDAFILKLNPTGSGLIYADFFGGLSNDTIFGLALDQNGNTYFAGSTDSQFLPATGFQQVKSGSPAYRTTTRGATWVNTQENLQATSVQVSAIDPVNPQVIYVGTPTSGLHKSFNGGSTWLRLTQNNSSLNSISAIAIDPKTPETVYVGSATGFYKSTDSGNIFALKQTGINVSGTPTIFAIAIDPVTPATVYIGSAAGIHKSLNGGETWTTGAIPICPPWIAMRG